MQHPVQSIGKSAMATALLLLACITPAAADPCVGIGSTSAPAYCRYASAPGTTLTVSGGGHTIILKDLFIELDPGPPGPIGSFFDVFFEIDLQPFVLMHGLGVWFTSPPPQDSIPPMTSVQIELLQLDLAAPGLRLRESPTRASTGQASSTDEGGGQIRIDSFFDVFAELSLDNGTTWLPATDPLHLTLQRKIPEPGSLALAGLALLLLARKRKPH
jgi:hypothetical protein